MARTKIDWCINPDGTPGHVWNPVKGCNGPAGDGVHCPYCYACRFMKRFTWKIAQQEINYLIANKIITITNEDDYWMTVEALKEKIYNFEPHFFEYVLAQKLRKKSIMYFINSMSDPADWEQSWYERIVEKINQYPQHIFIVLTKRPRIYEKYCFPINCWCGITITNQEFLKKWSLCLESFRRNNFYYRKMFFSIEPIQSKIDVSLLKKIKPDWLIVGPETGIYKKIPAEWLDPFFPLNIPVFMKNAWEKYTDRKLRQEWPEGYRE